MHGCPDRRALGSGAQAQTRQRPAGDSPLWQANHGAATRPRTSASGWRSSKSVPLLLLLYAVGTADGLTERAIRRSSGGRESASLYHRAKYLQMVVLGLGGLALLVWPGPVAWELCAGMIVSATGGLARMQWAFYKKHL